MKNIEYPWRKIFCCVRKKIWKFSMFFWKNENFQIFKNFIKETLLWIFWIRIFFENREKTFFTQKSKFLHGYSIFFIEIFFQSYPTHLLSTPESQPGGIGHGKSVGNPEICQWPWLLQAGPHIQDCGASTSRVMVLLPISARCVPLWTAPR